MSEMELRTTYERALARQAHEDGADEAQRAAEIVNGSAPPLRTRRRGRRVVLGVAALALVGLFVVRAVFVAGGRRGTEPIGAVATAEGAGVGSSVAGFLPEATTEPVASPSPATTPAPAPSPSVGPQAAQPTSKLRVTSSRPVAVRVSSAAPRIEPSPAPTPIPTPVPAPTPTPKPPPAVLNIGTRITAKLEAPVRTGATLTPATALVTADVTAGERVILPAGARLVGSAFATTGDDRVQILWRAVVVNGRSYRLDGEALSPDGSQGLTGKVVKKKGKGVLRRIGATLAGTAGETLGYGIPGGAGVTGFAEDALAGRAGRELQRAVQDREFLQADKVIDLTAGTALIAYVSADTLIAGEAP